MNNIIVEKLSENIGASILNVDINNLDDETLNEIKKALYENIVIFIKNQKNLEPNNLIDFSRKIGIPVKYPYNKESNLPLEITSVERSKDSNNIPIGSSGWHSDSSYLKNPPIYTMLYSINIPKNGGNTLFTNCYKIYEDLNIEIKNKIDNLKILNSSNLRPWLKKKKDFYNISNNPIETIHNAVLIHPITKKKSVYMNELHTHCIEDISKDESENILNHIFNIISYEQPYYNHKWEENTIAIWDNRCSQHMALDDCKGEYRLLWRILLNE